MKTKTKNKVVIPDIIRVGARQRKKHNVSEAGREAMREVARKHLVGGNKTPQNKSEDYVGGVKVNRRNPTGINQFTKNVAIWSPQEMRKWLEQEAPAEFCEAAGLNYGEGHSLADVWAWKTFREMILSADPYRRDQAQGMMKSLAAMAAEVASQTPGVNLQVNNFPERRVNVNFITPKLREKAKMLEAGNGNNEGND